MLSLGFLRRWGVWKWAVVCVVAVTVFARAEPMGLEVTKESKEEFDIDKQVILFYKNLLELNAEISAKQVALVEQMKDGQPEGRYPEEPVAILWTTPEFYNNFRGEAGTSDGEYIYLVQQPVSAHIVRGYTQEDNIFAKIRAKWHGDFVADEKADLKFRLKSNQLVLIFEGFVSIEVKALK